MPDSKQKILVKISQNPQVATAEFINLVMYILGGKVA